MLKEKIPTFNQVIYNAAYKSTRSGNLVRALYHTPYGKLRRALILQFCPEEGFPVNRKHTIQAHKDRDLTYLLKKGKLRRIEKSLGNNNYTYLVKGTG